MGDMADDFNAMRSARQSRHAEWKEKNMKALESSGVRYRATNSGETVLFRAPQSPAVDFYPSTGRWRIAGINKTFGGGAEKFLNWYRAQ